MSEHTAQLNAVLLRFVDRYETDLRAGNALQPHAKRFLLPREPGKPPVDPDAEQLARNPAAPDDIRLPQKAPSEYRQRNNINRLGATSTDRGGGADAEQLPSDVVREQVRVAG